MAVLLDTITNSMGKRSKSMNELMMAMQGWPSMGMGQDEADPRLQAIKQMMQMYGGGQAPPQLPSQMPGRPQMPHERESQIHDMYTASQRNQGDMIGRDRFPNPPTNRDTSGKDAAQAVGGRDRLADEAMEMIDSGNYDPAGPKGFSPKYVPGEFTPRLQRREEYFKQHVGDTPATDSEIQSVYDTDNPMFTNENQMIGEIPSPETPQTDEEEMQQIYDQMDADAGAGDQTVPLDDAIQELESDPEGVYDDFVATYGWDAVPDHIKQMKPEWMRPPQ